jgi:ABC-type lipoprotein export system ATPase subunit
MQRESREKFTDWLSSTRASFPFFHISGKLGSGKSTLMKYLCCHSRTMEELEKWAGKVDLLIKLVKY